MKRTFFSLLFLVSLFLLGTSGTRIPAKVRCVDKTEYTRYLEYCNTMVVDTIKQYGKIKVEGVNGQYTDSLGHFKPITTFWYKLHVPTYKYPNSTTKRVYKFEPDELPIIRRECIKVKQRRPSVRDFYECWMTNSIKK